MAKGSGKKSFILYNSYEAQFEKLDDRAAGQLIKALFRYINDGEVPVLEDAGADMAFSFICSQIERDKDAYEIKCEKNRRNGSLGGRPRKQENQTVSEKPNGFQNNQTVSSDPQPRQTQEPEQQPKKRTPSYTKHFEQFWEAYPRKEGKGECYKKYQTRLKDGYSEYELYSAAVCYAEHVRKRHTEKQYIKLGRTFLSDNMTFLDYLKKEDESSQTEPAQHSAEQQAESNPFVSQLRGDAE